MTREVEFRGRDGSGNWVYGGFFKKRQPCGRIDSIIHDGKSEYIVDAETVGQYTGINDKNEVRIYESDILWLPDDKSSMTHVVWDDFKLRLLWDNPIGFSDSVLAWSDVLEVVGNSHNDKDLLSKKESK